MDRKYSNQMTPEETSSIIRACANKAVQLQVSNTFSQGFTNHKYLAHSLKHSLEHTHPMLVYLYLGHYSVSPKRLPWCIQCLGSCHTCRRTTTGFPAMGLRLAQLWSNFDEWICWQNLSISLQKNKKKEKLAISTQSRLNIFNNYFNN